MSASWTTSWFVSHGRDWAYWFSDLPYLNFLLPVVRVNVLAQWWKRSSASPLSNRHELDHTPFEHALRDPRHSSTVAYLVNIINSRSIAEKLGIGRIYTERVNAWAFSEYTASHGIFLQHTRTETHPPLQIGLRFGHCHIRQPVCIYHWFRGYFVADVEL